MIKYCMYVHVIIKIHLTIYENTAWTKGLGEKKIKVATQICHISAVTNAGSNLMPRIK